MMKMISGWFRRRREARQAEYERRLARLLATYPEDDPFILSQLLSPSLTIQSVACKSLARAARRRLEAAEARAAEDRLRQIIRDEVHGVIH